MTEISIAFNRFGLGMRPDDAAPDNARTWLAAQLREFEPRPAALARIPTRTAIATQLADYLEQIRDEVRQAGAGRGGGAVRRRLAMNPDAAAGATAPRMQDTAAAGDPTAGLPEGVRQYIRGEARETYLTLAQARVNSALVAAAPFAERLTHFWANHFAVSIDKLPVIAMGGLLEFEAIRPNLMGKFHDLLLAVERHPAMLLYLDQAQSIGPNSRAGQLGARFAQRAGRPRRGINENLAREIMELHTLGVDTGYTQADVTEFARALTGWSVAGLTRGPAQRFLGLNGAPGAFAFVEAIHEPGPRRILGKSYDQDGEDQALAVLADLAAHPATAHHLATKLARHFAGDDPPPALVARLEGAWRASGGDLPTVYRALIAAPETWAPAPAKFKSPWDWAISAYRAVGVRDVPQPQAAVGLLNQLGEPIWRPGSPAGFDDIAASWAGPDALVRRAEAAQRLAMRAGADVDPRRLGERLFPGALSETTGQAIARAESPAQGLALLLVSPEFQRR